MSTSTLHPLAEGWLHELERAAAVLPPAERRELVADLRAHLTEALAPDAGEAEVRIVLDRLGDPQQIVAEAGGPEPESSRRGKLEWSAIVLVLAGGLLYGVGWLVGVVLLWTSEAWTVRDKLIGTLVPPGGLLAAAAALLYGLAGASQVCTGGSGLKTRCTGGLSTVQTVAFLAFLTASLILPMLTAVYLARHADRPRAS
jgi:hypothetical protein